MGMAYFETSDSLKLSIRQNKKGRTVLLILLILTFLSILFPIVILFIVELKVTTFIGVGFFLLIAIYFGRLFLWNAHGIEFLDITKDKIVHTLDYSLFKDVTEIENKEIILVTNAINSLPAENATDLLDDLKSPNQLLYSIIIQNRENEIIELNEELSIKHVERIMIRLNLVPAE